MLFVTLFEGAFDFVPHAFGCRMPMSGDEQQCENYGPKRSTASKSVSHAQCITRTSRGQRPRGERCLVGVEAEFEEFYTEDSHTPDNAKVRNWPRTDVARCPLFGRYRRQSGNAADIAD